MLRTTKKLDWKTDQVGLVTVPHDLSDLEIKSISFAYAKCSIALHAHENADENERARYYVIEIGNAHFVSFISDHLQNVVDSAHIFERTEREKATNFKDYMGNSMFPAACNFEAEYYFFISPITGGDLFIAADSIEFYRCRTAVHPH